MKFGSKKAEMETQAQSPFSGELALETSAKELSRGSTKKRNEPGPSEDAEGGFKKKFSKIKLSKKKIIIIVILVIAIVAAVFLKNSLFGGASEAQEEYTTETVARRDITSTLSGSGTLEAADSYTVTSMVKGEILADYFSEGDVIEKDAKLYTIDSSDASTSLEKARLSLEKSQDSYNKKLESLDDLNIKADCNGTVTEIFVEAGDTVQSETVIATIKNNVTMSLKLPFGADDVANFYVGQPAEVTLGGSFETLEGTVSEISNVDEVGTGYMVVRQVTIDVTNPGGLSDTETATAVIGDAACAGSGTFTYKDESQVKAGMSGEIASINVKEGNWVTKNQVIAKMDGSDLEQEIKDSANSLQDAQLSYDNQYDQLDDYSITSPIAGTVIEKSYKAGDKLEEAGKTLCIIYDLSYLTMTLNVDELDVSNVEEGQTVTITADAADSQTFEGVVTKVSVNGTTSNGVTSYPVTIQINETDGLLPGMNVDAEIIVESSENVLAVPIDAVTRGNRVLVQTDGSNSSKKEDTTSQAESNRSGADNGQPSQRDSNGGEGSMPEGTPPVNDTTNLPDMSSDGAGSANTAGVAPGNSSMTEDDIPEGFEYKTVTLGLSDDNYIEIVDGLEEGDVIAIKKNTASSSSNESAMMMGGGMAGGGGMPSGGGMPGGGPGGM